jgi:hypothetical protein
MAYLTHLGIYLELDATPIAGYITTEREPPRPFHGWLELSSAIEAQRAAGPGNTRPSERTLASSPSTRCGDSSRSSGAVPPRPAPQSGVPTGGRHGDVRHRAAVAWLAQRTQPRWMLLGAWTWGGGGGGAVAARALTRHIWVLAWWGLGLLATLVLLAFIWTEQASGQGPDDGDQPHPGGPPEPPQGARPPKGRHQGRSHVLEQRATPLGHNSAPRRKR